MSERTPQDYAIEHAEYMAKAVEGFVDLVRPLIRTNDSNRDDVIDHLRAVRSGIYEFRKRAARAHGAQATAQAEELK